MALKPAQVDPAPNANDPTPDANAAEPSLAEQLGILPDSSSADDADRARLDAALAELEAEGTAADAAAQQSDASQPPQAEHVETASQPDQTKPGTMVPVAAVQDVRQKNRELELELARERGRNETLEHMVLSGKITPEFARAVDEGRAELPDQAKTDPYKDIDAKDDALAASYEEGNISHVEYRKQQREIDRARREIERQVETEERRERAFVATKPVVDQIEAAFPSTTNMEQRLLDSCGRVALEKSRIVLRNKGMGQFDNTNPEHLKIFQFNVAHTADAMFNGGKDWAAFQAKKAGQQNGGTQPSAAQQPSSVARTPLPGRTTSPAQLIRDKVKLAETAPPDTTGIRDGNNSVPSTTEEAITRMTTEDIAKQPKEVLERIMGIG